VVSARAGPRADGHFAPLACQADKTGTVWFCGCKATKASPLCDGTHKSL
jgi:CDGSH-type Zn-finger protein